MLDLLFAVHQGNCVHILNAVSFIFCYEVHKKVFSLGKSTANTGCSACFVLLLALKKAQMS